MRVNFWGNSINFCVKVMTILISLEALIFDYLDSGLGPPCSMWTENHPQMLYRLRRRTELRLILFAHRIAWVSFKFASHHSSPNLCRVSSRWRGLLSGTFLPSSSEVAFCCANAAVARTCPKNNFILKKIENIKSSYAPFWYFLKMTDKWREMVLYAKQHVSATADSRN